MQQEMEEISFFIVIVEVGKGAILGTCKAALGFYCLSFPNLVSDVVT